MPSNPGFVPKQVLAASALNQAFSTKQDYPFVPSVVPFAGLPASPVLGTLAVVTDSTTAGWGSVVIGGGFNKVLAWFNGTNWTVIGS